MFGDDFLLSRLQLVIPLILSLSVHEWAHAFSARLLGDDTAERMGRLTLNPLAHIDPVGTVLLPLIGVPFGWAKPVPFNPLRFRRNISMRTGIMITAAAGPLSNVCLAAICTVVLALLIRFRPDLIVDGGAFFSMLRICIFLNVILAAFNALPIRPLDGSHVADALMPNQLRPAWESFCQLGPLPLAAVIILPILLGINLFHWPMQAVVYLLGQLLRLLGC